MIFLSRRTDYNRGKHSSRNKWRKLPACGVTTYRKLEAYATYRKLEAYTTYRKLEAYATYRKLEAYATEEFGAV